MMKIRFTYRNVFALLGLLTLLEILIHIRHFHVTRPATPLDPPFQTECREPPVGAPAQQGQIEAASHVGEDRHDARFVRLVDQNQRVMGADQELEGKSVFVVDTYPLEVAWPAR